MMQTGEPGVSGNLVMHLPGGQMMRMPSVGTAVGGVKDGDTLSINDGSTFVVFEFDSNGAQNLPQATVIPISSSPNPMSDDQLADAILAAIAAAPFTGLSPVKLIQGGRVFIDLQGPVNAVLDASLTPTIYQPYQPNLGLIGDGETFTITHGGVTRTFEFDNNNSPMTNVRVSFADVMTGDQILAAIRTAIIGAGLGLTPTISTDTHSLELNATARHTLNTNGTRIDHEGVPGGAVPVVFVPDTSFTAQDMARRIFEAIDTTPLLTGVTAELDEQRIIVEGVVGVVGLEAVAIPPIADLSGNPIRQNRPDGSTKFTIVMPGVDLDYGDAPDLSVSPHRFPTVLADNGARHAIIGDNPLRLGARVDADANGQPTDAASGDDKDFTVNLVGSQLTFAPRAPYVIAVPAASPALDGQSFTIDIGSGPVKFEFNELPGALNDMSAKPVLYNVGATANDMANAVVIAIMAAEVELGLTPVNLGGGQVWVGGETGDVIDLTGAPDVTLPATLPLSLQTPGAGFSLQLAETLQIQVPANGGAAIVDGSPPNSFTISNGVISKVFEFDRNVPQIPGSRVIPYTLTMSQDALAVAIVAALQMEPALGLSPSYLGDGVIHLGTLANHSVNLAGTPALSLVPGGQAGSIAEGDTFTIHNGVTPFVFEFDNTPGPGGVAATNIEIDFNAGQTRDQIAQSIVAAINGAAGLGLVATHLGNGSIELDGSTAAYTLTVPPLVQLTAAGVAGGVSDGDTFTLQAAGQTFVFEYDRDGNVALGNRAVVFTAGSSAEALATALAAAFADLPQEFNVNPTASGNVVSVSRDDEDGVTHGLLNQFLDTQFTITASGEGYLNAWIDYNQDGDWEDPGEHIFVDVALEPGVNAGPSLVTRTAAGALPGLTHARFRFSSVRGLSPTGLAEDGEVEDYVVNILPQRPPVAFVDNSYVTTEDALLNVPVGSGVLVNDTDADPDPKPSLVVFEVNGQQAWVGQEITLASGAKLTLNADGSFAYDPTTAAIFQTLAAGENSQDSFTYRASDQTAFGGLFSNEATVLIRIDGLNDAPTAFDDTFTGADEDTVFNIPALGVLANDTDIDASDVLSVEPVILTSSLGAQVTLNADGSISYDPRASATLQALAAGAQANDTFSYTLRDRVVGGLTDTGMVTVVVSGRNDAPIGVNDTGAPHVTDEDTTLVVSPDGVLGNDTDVDIPDTKTVVAVNGLPGNVGGTITLASGALLTMSANGGYVYNPNGRFDALQVGSSATDVFTYTVRDSQGATSIAMVTVTINGVNDAPVAVADTGLTNEDTVLNVPATGVLTNDTDKDAADTRVVSHVNGQAANVGAQITLLSGARLTMNADGSYTYDPRGSFDSLQVGTSDTDSFTYTVRDSQGATANGTVTITINGVNDSPTGVNDTGMTDENTVLNVAAAGVLANDIDVDAGDTLAVSAVNGVGANVGIPITLASGALLTLRANGSYTYSPNGKFESLQVGSTATDSFVYTVLDSQGASSTATVTITINGRNDAPVGVNDSSVTDEDTVLTVDAAGILANDTDVDTGDTKVVAAVNGSASNVGTQVTLASGALLTVNADGGYVFDPNGRYESLQTGTTATANFTYSVRDSQGAVATATVTITIQGRNDAPVGVNDSGATDEDTVLNVGPAGVLANDTDVDTGDTRTVSAVEGVAGNVGTQFTLASGALLTLRANGSYTYDPNDAFESLGLGAVGTDTFTYTLRDSRGGTSTATVTITIDGVNDAPVGVDDTVTANEDTVLTVSAAGVLANDTDVDAGDTKTVATINGAAANVGAQIALASGALLTVQADGGFLYDANGQFQSLQVGDTATDSFTYTVVDGQGASSAATVTIVVEGRNDAPVGVNDTGTTDEDTILTVAASGVLANDTDVDDGDTRIVSAVNGSSGGVGSQVTLPSGARLTMNADGGYVYDPNDAFESLAQGATGSDTFTYTVQDSQGASSAATVTITINGRNDAPVGVNDTGTTDEDTVLNVAAPGVLGNDLDVDIGDTRTVSAVNGAAARVGTQITLASGALLTVNANGGYSYNPARRFESLRPGQTASDSFNYTVRDSQGGVSTATVTITIEGRNEAPVAMNDVEQTFRNFDATFNLTENDTDIDGTIDHATITIVAAPVNGTLTVNANGTVLYRPKAEFAGTDVFTYQVRDNEGALSNVATVSVTILNPPNAWQNPIVNQDVNDDDLVTVLDALLVANNIRDNQALTGQIVHDLRNPDHMQVAPFRAPFVDPSGDALVTVGDLLSIVTVLRDQIQSEGAAPEGEASLASSSEFVSFDPFVGRHTIVATTEESNEIVDLPPQVVEKAFIDSTHGAVVASDDADKTEGDDQDASMDLEDVLSAIADDVSGQWSDF
jgi:VCBS repeat-containing protein